MSTTSPLAKKLIQLVHVGKGKMGLDEETYRQMLRTATTTEKCAGIDSCGRMTVPQLEAVLEHMASRGFKPTSKKGHGKRPHNADTKHRQELLKIEALLTDAGKPWAYAEGMLRHMTRGRKEALAFADGRELVAIIAALHNAAVKRLSAALEAVFGPTWCDVAGRLALQLFDDDSGKSIDSYPVAMSRVLRWWQGEIEAACHWPVVDKPGVHCCSGCVQRHVARSSAAS